MADREGFIQVDVQSRTRVIVSCSPELDGDFSEREFTGADARQAAERYAASEAKRLGVDYGSNEP